MTTHIALLKGINVGGKRRVAMGELRDLAAGLGLGDPATYIQSGNLIFDLDRGGSPDRLERALADRFGFEIPVITRTHEQLEEVAASHPFQSLGLDERLLMVAFLDREPDVDARDVIDERSFEPDRFEARGREIHLAYPNGSGRSKLTHGLLERRLGVRATIRNWKTILKLVELSGPKHRS